MSAAEELERLAALKASGSLSNEEFELLKRKLLYSEPSRIPPGSIQMNWDDVKLHQKWWWQGLSTLVLPIVGISIMLFSKAYFKRRDGTVAKRSVITKIAFVVLVLFVWAFNLARFGSNDFDSNFASADTVPACDSIEAKGALTDAIENSIESRQFNHRLLDLQNVVEAESVVGDVRRCNADFVLNSGTETAGYSIRNGSAGMILVELSPQPFDVVPKPKEEFEEQVPSTAEETDSSGILQLASLALSVSQHEKLIAAVDPTYLAEMSWEVVSSIDLGNDQAALLVETPLQTDEPNDCQICAPPLSLMVFSLINTSAPTGPNFSAMLLRGIGEWGETAEVNPVALPNGMPAFAFAWSFYGQGVQETGCAVVTLDGMRVQPEEFGATEFDCTPRSTR